MAVVMLDVTTTISARHGVYLLPFPSTCGCNYLLTVGDTPDIAPVPGILSPLALILFDLALGALGDLVLFIVLRVSDKRARGRSGYGRVRPPSKSLSKVSEKTDSNTCGGRLDLWRASQHRDETGVGTVSFVKGVDAEFTIEHDNEVIVFTSDAPLRPVAVFAGTANFQFPMPYTNVHIRPIFHQQEELTVSHPVPSREGGDALRLELDGSSSCAGIMNSSPMLGPHGLWAIRVSTVRLSMSDDHDIYLFHFKARSDSKIDYTIPAQPLVLTHGSSQVSASVRAGSDGELLVDVSFNGTGYERGSLKMRRELGECYLDEAVGDAKNGETASSFTWRPILRSLDEILICDSSTSERQLQLFNENLARGFSDPLGAHKWIAGGNFVLSDGAGLGYTLTMTGCRRFVSDDAQAKVGLSVRESGEAVSSQKENSRADEMVNVSVDSVDEDAVSKR